MDVERKKRTRGKRNKIEICFTVDAISGVLMHPSIASFSVFSMRTWLQCPWIALDAELGTTWRVGEVEES